MEASLVLIWSQIFDCIGVMADAVLVLSASPLTFPPEILFCYCHLPKEFPHYFHSLWNNIVFSLPIRFGTVDRSSTNAEALQKTAASRVRNLSIPQKKSRAMAVLLFFISFIFIILHALLKNYFCSKTFQLRSV